MRKYIFIFTILSSIPFFVFGGDAADTYKLAAPIPGASGGTATNIVDYFGYLIPFLLSFAGVAALVMFVYGAIEYMASGGNPSRMSSGKEKITSVLAGLGLAIFATVILGTINPKLLQLKVDLADVGKVDSTKNKVTDECTIPHCGGSCFKSDGCGPGQYCAEITDPYQPAGRPVGYACKEAPSQCLEDCEATGLMCAQDESGFWGCHDPGAQEEVRVCTPSEALAIVPPCLDNQVCVRVRRYVLNGPPSGSFECRVATSEGNF